MGHHCLVSGLHECPDCQLDDLVGTVTKDQLVWRYTQSSRQALFKVKAVSIRIEVELMQPLRQRLDGLGRGAQGIFVGGELYRTLDAILPLHLLYGFSRAIGNEVSDILWNSFSENHKPRG